MTIDRSSSTDDSPGAGPLVHWTDHPALLGLVVAGLGLIGLGLWLSGQPAGGRWLLGVGASLTMGLVGRWRGWLAPSGVVGALLTGTLTFGGGGLAWGGLLIAFFVASSLLSRLRRRQASRLSVAAAKGERRDLGQALANGGLAAGLAVAALIWPAPWLYAACVGALAAVTADTWSTEIGVRSGQTPRLITTLRPVPAGTNGGISLAGSLAGAAGGLFIGLVALLLTGPAARGGEVVLSGSQPLWLPLLGLLAGVGGGLADSLLGATVQAVRWCRACAIETERPIHDCGQATEARRGWVWLDNDRVNILASLTGMVVGLVMALIGR